MSFSTVTTYTGHCIVITVLHHTEQRVSVIDCQYVGCLVCLSVPVMKCIGIGDSYSGEVPVVFK